MNRDDIIAKLRALKPELAANNSVREIAIFGSFARGEARPDSDVDVLVEFDQSPGLFEFIRLQHALSDELGSEVDLVTIRALHPALREQILSEAIYV